MKNVTRTMLVLLFAALSASVADAQLLDEPKRPGPYDPVGDMRYTFERGAPSEIIRETQRALREKGYYHGPIDGVSGPEFRTALWNFQRAKGLPHTGRLDVATAAALELPATGAASPPMDAASPPSFGSRSGAPHAPDVEAP